jgi:sensor histidine kinase YesM
MDLTSAEAASIYILVRVMTMYLSEFYKLYAENDFVMNYQFLAGRKKKFWRYGSILLTAIFLKILIDLSFGLTYTHYQFTFSLQELIWIFILVFLLLEGIRYININLDKKYPWENSPAKRLVYQLLSNGIYAIGIIIFIRFLAFQFEHFFLNKNLIIFRDEVTILLLAIGLTLLIIFIEFGIYILNRYRYSLAELERFKKENVEFNLEMLKNQVNPHFLFNSLNTLSSLIFQDQESAASFVRQLARVYRYVLENKETKLVMLKNELEILESYIYLQNIRYGENISFNVSVDEEKRNWQIAPLTLQMLIENAIKHNVVSRGKPLFIDIYTDPYNNIVVKNTLQKKKMQTYSSGIGLKNIRSRYAFLIDRKLRVLEGNEYFTVKVPLIENSIH